jgi:hypothetical protein
MLNRPEYLPPEILKGLGHSKTADWWVMNLFHNY